MAVADRPAALILRALGLGDLLTAVPALRGIRAALPGHEVVIAVPPWLVPMVALIDSVDSCVEVEVLPGAVPDCIRWHQRPPEIVFNLHGRGPQSHLLLTRMQPERIVAFARADLGVAGPPWRQAEHEVQRWVRLVSAGLGVTCDPDALDIAVPQHPFSPAGAVVIHPGAAYPARCWPLDRFASVAAALRDRGHEVVVTGSAQESEIAAAVAHHAGLPEASNLAGRTNGSELAALIAAASLTISGDTGISHLATAYRRPSVTLFGPVPPTLWGPPARPQHLAIWHGPPGSVTPTGDPWGRTLDPLLDQIAAHEVISACTYLLANAG